MTKAKTHPASRRLIRALIGVLLLGVIAGLVAFIATREAAPEKAPPIQARLELAAGEVTVDLGDGARRAVSGTALLANAKVTTAKGARALVRLPDGSTLFMRGGSSVALHADKIELTEGEYWLSAPPTDRKAMVHHVGEVSVSAADAGLSVKRTDGAVVVYTARGMATVTGPGGRVEVKAGEQATVKGNAQPVLAAVAFWDDWTGGMADFESGHGLAGAGAGTIYGVDDGAEAGNQARRLEISKQTVHAVVRGGLSETEVDQTFFNPGERPVEGWYWFTVPERASVTGFAVETDGVLVEGEFTEKKEAAQKYGVAKATGHSPAILEWIDNRTYRARIYPVDAGGTRRVVLRYIELRPITGDKLEYVYPMGSGDPVRIGEFSLRVDLGDAGKRMTIATLADARIENAGERVTMRRSGYTPRAPFQLEATLPDERPPFRVARFESDGDSADYVMARYTPDVDWASLKTQRADVVVVVDTSAAGDETSRQLKAATTEAILRALSDDDRFALVSLDVRPTVLHPKQGLAAASEKQIAQALEALADHSSGGATDLAASFDVSLARLHKAEQPAVVYVGDGIATSGDLTGEQLVERLRRALSTSRARLFSVGVGTDANHALLGELARAGGGESFRIDENEQTTARALQLAAAIKQPTITDLEVDLGAGLDEPFVSADGKVSRGSEVVVLARTHHDIPREVTVRGRLAGESFEKSYEVKREDGVISAFVPRLWAAEYVRRLLGAAQGPDAERGRIVSLGLEYGLMTPFTSVLALESEAAYSRMGIPRRRSKLRGVRLGALSPDAERRLTERLNPWAAPATAMGCSLGDFAPGGEDKAEPTAVEPVSQASEPVTLSPGAPLATAAESEEDMAPQAVAAPEPEALAEEKPMEAPMPATAPPVPPSDDDGVAVAGKAKAGSGLRGGSSGFRAPARQRYARKPKPGLARLEDANEGEDTEQAELRAKIEVAKKLAELQQHATGLGRPASLPEPALGTCSDSARRPLAQRVLLWSKRLRVADGADELLERYESARKACELGDWRAERTFLDMLQRRVDSEGGVELVLHHFGARPEVQKHVAKLILRRAVDDRMVSVVERVLFGNAVNWLAVDLKLQAMENVDERIAALREAMAEAPDDPAGGIRLVRLLVEAGRKDEALNLGRRLRDQGFLTPHIARQLGDVLARAKLEKEAVRTYSEIVEFDPDSVASRKLLGDIYLGHGWYQPAYRQYRTLTEMAPDEALGWLRLAAAAAGSGRTDEALRLERKVASAQGTPGPKDPRRWARLSSAARIARLLEEPPKPAPGQPKVDPARRAASLQRELKELGLFSGPGTLVVLTWEDLSADLLLVSQLGDEDVALGEHTDAAPAGLSAILMSTADAGRAKLQARLRSLPADNSIVLVRHELGWDGKRFRVTLTRSEMPAGATRIEL